MTFNEILAAFVARSKADLDKVLMTGKAQGGGGNNDRYDEGFEVGKQTERQAFWDTFQQNGTRTNYNSAFKGRGFEDNNFYPCHDIVVTGESVQMFYDSRISNLKARLDELGIVIDLSQATGLNGTFYSAYTKELPVVDVANCDTFTSTFGTNEALSFDGILNIKETATFNAATFSCIELVDIKQITGTIGTTVSFTNCNAMSAETAIRIISILKNYAGTDKAGVYSITFHNNVWNRLEAESPRADGKTWKEYIADLGWNT